VQLDDTAQLKSKAKETRYHIHWHIPFSCD